MAMTTEEKRSELIRKAKGETTQYDIEFFIDAGGVITILGGMESTHSKPHHIIHGGFGDNYLSLLRGKNGEDLGQDLINRQREQEKKLTQEELDREFLKFRKKYPNNWYGYLASIKQTCDRQQGIKTTDEDVMNFPDYDKAELEQKKRNRQYIKEFYGLDLPLEYDFKKEYESWLERQR